MKLNMRVIFATCLAAIAAQPAPAQVTGSGTTNYTPVWKSGSSIGNSIMYQNSLRVGIGTTSPSWELDVNGRVNSADGEIQTIQYQKLTPMLMNELNKQHRLIEQLEKRLAALEAK
jgi:hypothetical protein